MDNDGEHIPLEEAQYSEEQENKVEISDDNFNHQPDQGYSIGFEPIHDDVTATVPEGVEPNGSANNLAYSADGETGEKPMSALTAHSVAVDVDEDKPQEEELVRRRECMFFEKDGEKLRIDYVLVYKQYDKKPARAETRDIYLKHLEEYDLVLYSSPTPDITDPDTFYILVHATWDTLITGAELLNIKKRLKMPPGLERKLENARTGCTGDGCRTSQQYIEDEGDFFTAPMHHNRLDLFDIQNKETFFSNAERSLIVKEVLDRTSFTPDSSTEVRFGVSRLIQENIFENAYPLHEGPLKPIDGIVCQDAFDGKDKDRGLLYETWARTARWACYQPLDLIRKYFGEKIGLYFAWLGFYTQMLIPAAFVGLAAFIYGLATMFNDQVSEDICDNLSDTVICPQCNVRCDYWMLKESCLYSRITHLFDNYATVIFTLFMGIWGVCFLEFWKRKQNELQYEWDVQDFEAQERMRPEFEFKVRRRKENPITKVPEPYLTRLNWCCRSFTSLSIAIFFILVVVAAILGVIIYRFVIVTILFTVDISFVSSWAKIITSVTASVINLIVIMILGLIYKKVSYALTDMELHRTETDFEDAYTFKMYLFQFVNYYGTTFYIAFFKGKFTGQPGSKQYYLFGFEPDTCDPSGCMMDLVIQLFIVMVGKQALNQFKEIIIPKILVFCRQKQAKKVEDGDKVYTRWMQDHDMQPADRLMLFDEYLEMVIQFGFVTVFVAAFPLAPLFALMNNVIEIRLDAYKFVTQYQRPVPSRAQDIGVWFGILQSLTYIAVLSNAVIIAWTSDFIPRMVYQLVYSQDDNLVGYVNNSLSYFDVNDYSNDTRPDDPTVSLLMNGTTCRYKGYNRPPDDPNKYGFTLEFWHITVARLAFILIFEHAVVLLTYLISVLIPDVSGDVKRLKSYEKALNRHLTFKSTFEDKKEEKKHSNSIT